MTATNDHEAGIRPAASIEAAMRELRRRPRQVWLDLARADQSHRWRTGTAALAERYFEHLPELFADTEEALVLICGEIHLRREAGERPDRNHYEERFPTLAREIALQFDVDRILDDGHAAHSQHDSDASPHFAPELPGYEFLDQVGTGASGIVYRARQLSLDRHVAIKVLAMPGADPKRLARQCQEAEILARLQHPNIVHVYEVAHHHGCLYLVMEFVDGPTLKEFAAGTALHANDAARLVLTLADTMQAVHDAGVLHRDLKPSNVLITPALQLRITDFGLAKLRYGDNLLTTEDSVLGTPSYMSPEQALGSSQTAGLQTDVYSMGAILYELLTGRPPFLGATVLDTLSLIREQEPVPPRQLQLKTPRDLETVCLHCLHKSPQSRYPTARALAEDLHRFLAGEPVVARRSTQAERLVRWCRRNPAVAALAGTTALLLIATLAILIVKNAGIRREAAAKDAALATARQAVDQMLMRVANYKLSNMPLGHPLRKALLQDALRFYEGLLPQAGGDIALRMDLASVLQNIGLIQRELGQFDDAIRSYERGIEYIESIVDRDPQPPRLREKLAETHEALAFTWSIHRTAAGRREAELQFRKTLRLFREIERDFPARLQPVGLCLRQLADSAFKQGDRKQAEHFWRQAIDGGEAYLEQHPSNIDARVGLCWACGELCDAILLQAPNSAAEAEPILNKGLMHCALILERSPRSTQARDVRAFLSFSLARCYCRLGRLDEAAAPFQQALDEIHSLCAEFPWNRQHWDSLNYFQRETVREFQEGHRPAQAADALEDMVDWLKEAAPQLPPDTVPQAELRRCQAGLIALLRSAGRHDDARALRHLTGHTSLSTSSATGN
jgi:serine/threonine-protein kinase